MLCAGTAISSHAQTYTVLHSFGGAGDGEQPEAGLIIDAKGNLYGSLAFGGTHVGGVIFKMDASGNETVLYNFGGSPSDGLNPYGNLIIDSTGNLFGTTDSGGSNAYGTVFELDASGVEAVIHSFTGPPSDGRIPRAGLVRDASGNLYGTTTRGGAHDLGTVFKVDANGQETVLHSFNSYHGKDGAVPYAALILANDKLYGTTSQGGNLEWCESLGCGTVFQVDPSSGKETVLYKFNGPNGVMPVAALSLDPKGNVYVTAIDGGATGAGVVLKRGADGKVSTLYSFAGPPTDGWQPWDSLISDASENLYGTTAAGGTSGQCGPSGCGTVFKLDPSGTETLLHSFTNSGGDGAIPYAGLVMDAAGNLYGTTSEGGAYGQGTAFKLTP